MNDSARFEIVGAIVQKFSSPSGKFAAFKVETKINGFKTVHNVKSFDQNLCRQLQTAGIGEMIKVTGEVASGLLTNKDKSEVLVSGYKYHETMLKATKIESVTQSSAPLAPIDDDKVPF